MVNALLKSGADLNARASDGTTPLFSAVEFNQEEVASFLIDMRASVDTPDLHRNSALHVAASSGFTQLVMNSSNFYARF